MNIDKIGQNAVDAYVQKTQSSAVNKAASQGTNEVKKSDQDAVSISQAAKEMQQIQKAVQDAPDVREDKVEAIKKQIHDGIYSVPTEAVVEKLLSIFTSEK